MQTTYIFNGKVYTFSNDGLKEGDEVWPISTGKIENGVYIHTGFSYPHRRWNEFPDEPHIIEDLHHSDYKPYEVRTNYGYGSLEQYFKIINVEDVKEGEE